MKKNPSRIFNNKNRTKNIGSIDSELYRILLKQDMKKSLFRRIKKVIFMYKAFSPTDDVDSLWKHSSLHYWRLCRLLQESQRERIRVSEMCFYRRMLWILWAKDVSDEEILRKTGTKGAIKLLQRYSWHWQWGKKAWRF